MAWVLSRGDDPEGHRLLCVVRGGEQAARALAGRANRAGFNLYGDAYRVEQVPADVADSLPVVDPTVEVVDTLVLTADAMPGRPVVEGERQHVEWPFDALYEPVPVRVERQAVDGGWLLTAWGTDHQRVRQEYARSLAEVADRDEPGRQGQRGP